MPGTSVSDPALAGVAPCEAAFCTGTYESMPPARSACPKSRRVKSVMTGADYALSGGGGQGKSGRLAVDAARTRAYVCRVAPKQGVGRMWRDLGLILACVPTTLLPARA